jgi:hypothetical protein
MFDIADSPAGPPAPAGFSVYYPANTDTGHSSIRVCSWGMAAAPNRIAKVAIDPAWTLKHR